MPLPIPNLDDRRFDDLVAEAKARLATHLPELTHIAPGDPIHCFIDLFAWLTETILYRANLVPERLRRVFLNLLQIPVRPARPARGIVCIDGGATVDPPTLVKDGRQLKAGSETVTTVGEVLATCLGLRVASKQTMSLEELHKLGLGVQDLTEQFGVDDPTPFRPKQFVVGKELLGLEGNIDSALHLAFVVPPALQSQLSVVRETLRGIPLNLGIAAPDELDGHVISEVKARPLRWELASRVKDGDVVYIPLEVLSDSSRGGRQTGVVRLRLPNNAALFDGFVAADPMFGGMGDGPPELPDPAENERVAFWLRLTCPEHPNTTLSYLGVNAVDVVAQGEKQNLIVGIGTGRPDQVIQLPDKNVDADSLIVEVEKHAVWEPWTQVGFLAGHSRDDRVYQLDSGNGFLYFGDGVTSGFRPPVGAHIRVAQYRFGGGATGNLPPRTIGQFADGESGLKIRHEWPLRGGIDAETVEQAEKRIPQFLTHRNRAVTRTDFEALAESNPIAPVGRAEVRVGFLPGATIEAARDNVPGVVSVFVIPPGVPRLAQTPKPTQGLLKDVFGYLLQRVLVGTELYVLSPEFVPVAVSVKVSVLDVDTEQEVLRDVQQAMVEYLWPLTPGGAQGEGWPMGGTVRTNELMTQAARVPGVLSVNDIRLFRSEGRTWKSMGPNEELLLKMYQLPELVGVLVESGAGVPKLPSGLASDDAEGNKSRAVPVPVIPEFC